VNSWISDSDGQNDVRHVLPHEYTTGKPKERQVPLYVNGQSFIPIKGENLKGLAALPTTKVPMIGFILCNKQFLYANDRFLTRPRLSSPIHRSIQTSQYRAHALSITYQNRLLTLICICIRQIFPMVRWTTSVTVTLAIGIVSRGLASHQDLTTAFFRI
jgi:hypothetical protein